MGLGYEPSTAHPKWCISTPQPQTASPTGDPVFRLSESMSGNLIQANTPSNKASKPLGKTWCLMHNKAHDAILLPMDTMLCAQQLSRTTHLSEPRLVLFFFICSTGNVGPSKLCPSTPGGRFKYHFQKFLKQFLFQASLFIPNNYLPLLKCPVAPHCS